MRFIMSSLLVVSLLATGCASNPNSVANLQSQLAARDAEIVKLKAEKEPTYGDMAVKVGSDAWDFTKTSAEQIWDSQTVRELREKADKCLNDLSASAPQPTDKK